MINRALISNAQERYAFWKSSDFLNCFESSISLKTVKKAQEANRQFMDDGKYLIESVRKRDASPEAMHDSGKKGRF